MGPVRWKRLLGLGRLRVDLVLVENCRGEGARWSKGHEGLGFRV